MEATCRMCRRAAKLVKAHIIPRSLNPHRFVREITKMYSRVPGTKPHILQNGVYDKNILCELCERQFDKCDRYAQRVLRAVPPPAGVHHFELHSIDYPLLKRFFVGILWRAAVSEHIMFAKIKLEPATIERLRKIIVDNEVCPPEEFPVMLSVFDDDRMRALIIQPMVYEKDGNKFCRFNFAGYRLLIQIDGSPLPDFLARAILRPTDDVMVSVASWNGSSEEADCHRLAAESIGP